jgi:hypothetical protein
MRWTGTRPLYVGVVAMLAAGLAEGIHGLVRGLGRPGWATLDRFLLDPDYAALTELGGLWGFAAVVPAALNAIITLLLVAAAVVVLREVRDRPELRPGALLLGLAAMNQPWFLAHPAARPNGSV